MEQLETTETTVVKKGVIFSDNVLVKMFQPEKVREPVLLTLDPRAFAQKSKWFAMEVQSRKRIMSLVEQLKKEEASLNEMISEFTMDLHSVFALKEELILSLQTALKPLETSGGSFIQLKEQLLRELKDAQIVPAPELKYPGFCLVSCSYWCVECKTVDNAECALAPLVNELIYYSELWSDSFTFINPVVQELPTYFFETNLFGLQLLLLKIRENLEQKHANGGDYIKMQAQQLLNIVDKIFILIGNSMPSVAAVDSVEKK